MVVYFPRIAAQRYTLHFSLFKGNLELL
jgi:hypothetical protein